MPSLEELLTRSIPELKYLFLERDRPVPKGLLEALDADPRHGAQYLVFVSTDKAVAPHSVMGATKRIAEMLVVGDRGNGIVDNGTPRCTAVRFGNVPPGDRGTDAVLDRARLKLARNGIVNGRRAVRHPSKLSN